MQPLSVVICGGGFAAAGRFTRSPVGCRTVTVTPLAPDEYLNYRPQTVLTPFTGSPVARYPIGELAAVAGTQWVRDRLASVNLGAHRARTTDGQSLVYDALLLAPGAPERKPSPHVALFTDRTKGQTFRGIVEEIDAGAITSLTLIEPGCPSWPLPLYELALLTAKHVHDRGLHVQIALTPLSPRPLYPFGEVVGATVQRLLQDAGVTLYLRTSAHIVGPRLVELKPSGVQLHQDRIVTLPTIIGPNVQDVPGDTHDRFIPVDDRCRVSLVPTGTSSPPGMPPICRSSTAGWLPNKPISPPQVSLTWLTPRLPPDPFGRCCTAPCSPATRRCTSRPTSWPAVAGRLRY